MKHCTLGEIVFVVLSPLSWLVKPMLSRVFRWAGISLLRCGRCRIYGDDQFIEEMNSILETLRRCDALLYRDIVENPKEYWFVGFQETRIRHYQIGFFSVDSSIRNLGANGLIASIVLYHFVSWAMGDRVFDILDKRKCTLAFQKGQAVAMSWIKLNNIDADVEEVVKRATS